MSVIGRVEAAIRVVREGRCDGGWCKVAPADLEKLPAVLAAAHGCSRALCAPALAVMRDAVEACDR